MSKKTQKQQLTPSDDDETSSAMVMGMLGSGLEALRKYIDRVAAAPLDPEGAADFAHLLTKVAMTGSELRKSEKAARDADGALTTAQILEYVRRLPRAEQQQFARSVQNLNADAGKSGLA
jgi:hypothetical protein